MRSNELRRDDEIRTGAGEFRVLSIAPVPPGATAVIFEKIGTDEIRSFQVGNAIEWEVTNR